MIKVPRSTGSFTVGRNEAGSVVGGGAGAVSLFTSDDRR
jgi:hypothetical protein